MFIGNKIRKRKVPGLTKVQKGLSYKSYFGYAQSAGNSFISNILFIIYYYRMF